MSHCCGGALGFRFWVYLSPLSTVIHFRWEHCSQDNYYFELHNNPSHFILEKCIYYPSLTINAFSIRQFWEGFMNKSLATTGIKNCNLRLLDIKSSKLFTYLEEKMHSLIQHNSYAQFHLSILPPAMPPTQAATTSESLWLNRKNQPVGPLTLTRLASYVVPALPSSLQSPEAFLTIDEVNYSISLTSRSHWGQLYQPDYSSQPELSDVENAVPLAASLGTEQASAVWSLSQVRVNLACRGLWRISLMKYIYDLLQTCIVPHYQTGFLLMGLRLGRARLYKARLVWAGAHWLLTVTLQ